MTQVGKAYEGPIYRTAAPALRQALDSYDQVDRHWGRDDLEVQAISPIVGPFMVMGKYAPKWQDDLHWETNAYGRRVWMMGTMFRILVAVRSELQAGHDLSGKNIAAMAGASRGYVSKALRWLDRFGFITILGIFRGRWGRTIAKLRLMFPPPLERRKSTGGNIKPKRPTADAWGAWERALARVEARQ